MGKQKHKQDSFKDFLKELEKNSIDSPKKVETIEERKYFLIVCEGTRTEPEYFNYLKKFLPKHLLETIEVKGEGDNTINIVKKAILLRDERKEDVLLPDFEEVWAVFDKDDFPNVRYNQAMTLAKRENIKNGDSNQSFELWYVLHFQYLDTAINRGDYIKILTKELGYKYEKKNPKVAEYLFKNCNVKRAIEWAKKLEKNHIGKTPAKSHPSTNVYKLVEMLLDYSKYEY